MKHTCHICKKNFDCGKKCDGPQDYPCDECISKMGVEDQAIQCLPTVARMEIAKTCKKVQFRLSACWKDGFTEHDVRFMSGVNFSVNVALSKGVKK